MNNEKEATPRSNETIIICSLLALKLGQIRPVRIADEFGEIAVPRSCLDGRVNLFNILVGEWYELGILDDPALRYALGEDRAPILFDEALSVQSPAVSICNAFSTVARKLTWLWSETRTCAGVALYFLHSDWMTAFLMIGSALFHSAYVGFVLPRAE